MIRLLKILKGKWLDKKTLLLAVLLLPFVQVLFAQNINVPNKMGPMGLEVNTLTGNLFFTRNDLYIPARGFDIDISFSYNSVDHNLNRGYGKGWSFQYLIKYQNDSAGTKTILWGDGREDSYSSLGGGAFKSPAGFFDTLSEYQPGKFRLSKTNGIKFFFDNATHKRVTKIEEPNNNYFNFTYTDSLLTSITNTAGQVISLGYTGGRLTTVTDAITTPTRTWQYTYDAAGNLTQVRDPLNNTNKYSYLVNGPMKAITDKNNNKVDVIYYPGFMTWEMIGCNKRVSFSYDSASLTTHTTDHLTTGSNQITKYEFKKQEGKTWLSGLSGNCCGFNMKFEFDAAGNKIKETDAKGQITTFTYDSRGNMLTMTDPLNQTITYTYTSNFNNVSSYRDEKGFITTMNYDSRGNLIQLTDPGNRIFAATYHSNGDLLTSTDPKGNVYNYSYDAFGNPLIVTGPNGYQATLGFDARGNLLAYTDARSNTTNLEYDILNRLKKIIDPLNDNIRLNYDAEGNATSLINENNETSLMGYDASNRLVQVTDVKGNNAFATYDGMDNITRVTNVLGNATKMSYDTRNRLTGITDAEGNTSSINYDDNGNITAVNLPNGGMYQYSYDQLDRITAVSDNTGALGTFEYDKNSNVTRYSNGTGAVYMAQYDSLNRMKKMTDPLGNSVTLAYDKNNNILTVTDRNGQTSLYTYDSLNRIKTQTDNNGNVTTVTYDATGNVIALKDQNNNITNYTYDNLNRVQRITYPDARFIEFTYNNKGNIITKRLTDGTNIGYTYDSLNRVVTKTLPGGHVFSYTYDALGRVLTATNNSGIVTISYDVLNRVTSETYNGRTVNYSYNITGRTQTTIYPDSTVIVKNFDTRNRLTSISRNNEVLVSYQYNILNQVVSKTFGNGVTSNMQYDFANRLSNITTAGGNIQNTNFSYNNEQQKTAIERLNNPAKSEQFTYDNGHRLTNYKRGVIGAAPTIQNSYTYDALGNRTNANLNGINTNYTSNNLNQLTNSNNGTLNINYTYDTNGNQTYDGRFYKIYDAEKRLLKDSASPSNVISYQYDAFGRRVRQNLNGNILNYTFSGLQPIEERNNAGGMLNKTIFSNFLTPLVNEKNNNSFFYHQNELNSVEAISNQQGRLVEQYEYDVYGKMSRYDSLGNALPGSITGNRFGFTGQLYDSASGNYKFFFREYNPETGVFNQRDLIGYADGMGMYQYVHNNPANGVDILGLDDNSVDAMIDFVGNTVGNANSITPGLSEMVAPVTEFIVRSENGQHIVRIGELTAELGLRAQAYNASLKFLNSNGLTFLLIPINIVGTIKSINNMRDPCATDGEKVDASINTFSGGLNSAMGLYTAGRFLYWGAKGTLGANSLLSHLGVNAGARIIPSLGIGTAGGLHAASATFSPATMFGRANLALAGGLAMYSLANMGWQKATSGLSFAQTGEVIDLPLIDVAATATFSQNSKQAVFQMMKKDFFSYSQARDRVEAKGSRGGGGHWKAPKPGAPNKKDCPQNNGGGSQKPGASGAAAGVLIIVLNSLDPNEIIGPVGVDVQKWVNVNDRLPYMVLYENDKSASAPAKYVKITSPIEPKEDAATFQLGSFGFNTLTFEVPANISSYYKRLDARDSLGLYVDVIAGYDQIANQAFWEFQSIDPLTLLPPTDPLKGFLLLQDSTKPLNGHGFVNFSIKPKTNALTLDTIGARASIIFDANDTIPTNIHTNTIDAFAPTSQMNAITSNTNPVALSWTGVDDTGGCGIDFYTIYVSRDQVNYSVFIPRISRTDTSVVLPPDSSYCFFVLATDRVGNKEELRPGEIKCTSVGPPLPVSWLYFRGKTVAKTNELAWATASEQNSKHFEVERSVTGSAFNRIGIVPAAGNSNQVNTYQYTDPDIDRLNSQFMFYRLKQVDMDGNYKYSNVIRLQYWQNQFVNSLVYPNPTTGSVTILVGDPSLVGTSALLHDINGKLLGQIKITASSQQIDLSKYVNGIYFIRLSNNEVLKIIKQ